MGAILLYPSTTRRAANDNSPSPIPPPAAIQGVDYRFHAMQMIERFANRVAARPNFKSERPAALTLAEAQCEHECDRCYMECAIAPARLAWWEGELAKACGSSAIGRA